MVILPPARAPRLINCLKSCVLKLHFTNKYVTAQVIHSPTARDVAAAAKIGKILAECPQLMTTRDVAAAAKIEKIVAERLQL